LRRGVQPGDNSCMRPNRPLQDRGFTLVELMIVVAVIGAIASLAIPGYMRFTARAHRAEMMETVSKIKLHFKSNYDNTGSFVSATTPAIGTASSVNPTTAGVKVGQAASWDSTATGWSDLQFPPEGAVRMRYSYTISAPDTVVILVCGSFAALGGTTVSCATGNGGGSANYSYQETFSGNGTSTIAENPTF
jgi:prepilin-type N-terminal cleavage/methylation domain-containing protein